MCVFVHNDMLVLVDIHVDSWTHFGFSWVFASVIDGSLCPKVCLLACQQLIIVFTKLLRLLLKRWRFSGFRVILYVDDDVCVGSTAA